MIVEHGEIAQDAVAKPAAEAKMLLKREISFVDNHEFRSNDAKITVNQAVEIATDWQRQSATTLPVSAPLYRVCQQPLLSKAEERVLFFGMNALKFRANSLRASINLLNLNTKTVATCKQNLHDALVVRDMIIASNIRLVLAIVREFNCNSFSHDELASDGIEALIRATEKFDFDRGFRFSTYATTVIRRHFGRIAKSESRRRTRFTTAIPETLDDSLPVPAEESALQTATTSSMSVLLQSMMNSLDDRERLILRRRFGFDQCESKPTLSRIAGEFGVCKERVRQIESRAIKKMRRMCNDRLSNEVKEELEAAWKS